MVVLQTETIKQAPRPASQATPTRFRRPGRLQEIVAADVSRR
jgi:hypothetical protein